MSQGGGDDSGWGAAEPAPPWDEYGWPAAGQPDRYGAAGGQSMADPLGIRPDPYRNGTAQHAADPGFSTGPQHPAWLGGHGPPAGRHTPDPYRHRRPEDPADSHPAPLPYAGTDSYPGSNGPGRRPGSHARGGNQNGGSAQYGLPDEGGQYGPADQGGQPGQYSPPGQYGLADRYTAPDRGWSPPDGPQGSDGAGPPAGYPDQGRYDPADQGRYYPADQRRAADSDSGPGTYREPDPAAETQSYAIPERAWSPDPLSNGSHERADPYGAGRADGYGASQYNASQGGAGQHGDGRYSDGRYSDGQYSDGHAGPPWSPQAQPPPWAPADGREVPGPGSYPGREQWPAGGGYGSPDPALPAALDGPFRWQAGQPGTDPAGPDQDNTSQRPWSPGPAGHAGDMGADRDGGRHGRSRGGRRAARDQDYDQDYRQDRSADGSQPGYQDDEAGYRDQLPGGRAARHTDGFLTGQPGGYSGQRAADYQQAGDYPQAGDHPQRDAGYAATGRAGHAVRRGSHGRAAGPAPAGDGGPAGGFLNDLGSDAKPPKRKRGRGWVAAVIALLVIVAAGSGAAYVGLKWWQGRHGNYVGSGTGQVIVQVQPGEYPAQLAPTLVRLGVIKTTEPFIDAAKLNDPTGLEPGYFRLRKHMNAALAWALLLSPKARVQTVVTIPDGLRGSDIIALLAKKTGIPLASYDQALKDSAALGLPPYANGNVEGYLYPATYDLPPHATALSVLQMMVAQFNSQAASLGLAAGAHQGNMTEAQVITEASLLEAEVNRTSYYPMVARVLDNRLDSGMMLQLDSTVAYAVNKYIYDLSKTDLAVNSPYNTFLHKGLPPGPIDSPDAAAISAVLHPAAGDWTYFITVNPKTGQTNFTNSYAQFQVWSNEAIKNGA